MKYQANPIIVTAYKIISASPIKGDIVKSGSYECILENGDTVVATLDMCTRYQPIAGDYWVIQPDGYVYLNPKDVFEKKYTPAAEEKGQAENAA